MTPIDEEIAILQKGLDAYRDEYKEQADIWKTLEGKAQTVITVSGVFLAAAFAFSHEAHLPPFTRCLVLLALITLICALFFAFWVLRVQAFDMPFDATAIVNQTIELVAMPNEELGVKYKRLLTDLVEGNDDVLKGIAVINERKQSRLGWANALLFVAAVCAATAAVTTTLSQSSVCRID